MNPLNHSAEGVHSSTKLLIIIAIGAPSPGVGPSHLLPAVPQCLRWFGFLILLCMHSWLINQLINTVFACGMEHVVEQGSGARCQGRGRLRPTAPLAHCRTRVPLLKTGTTSVAENKYNQLEMVYRTVPRCTVMYRTIPAITRITSTGLCLRAAYLTPRQNS